MPWATIVGSNRYVLKHRIRTRFSAGDRSGYRIDPVVSRIGIFLTKPIMVGSRGLYLSWTAAMVDSVGEQRDSNEDQGYDSNDVVSGC